jgi:hypothetical protein
VTASSDIATPVVLSRPPRASSGFNEESPHNRGEKTFAQRDTQNPALYHYGYMRLNPNHGENLHAGSLSCVEPSRMCRKYKKELPQLIFPEMTIMRGCPT